MARRCFPSSCLELPCLRFAAGPGSGLWVEEGSCRDVSGGSTGPLPTPEAVEPDVFPAFSAPFRVAAVESSHAVRFPPPPADYVDSGRSLWLASHASMADRPTGILTFL